MVLAMLRNMTNDRCEAMNYRLAPEGGDGGS